LQRLYKPISFNELAKETTTTTTTTTTTNTATTGTTTTLGKILRNRMQEYKVGNVITIYYILNTFAYILFIYLRMY
jgi:hypothetical protein